MNLQPLNDMILVRVDPPETKVGNILLTEPAVTNTGTVIAVGPGKVNAAGIRVPVGLAVGDKVLFRGYGVEPVKDTEADKLLMSEDKVIARIVEVTTSYEDLVARVANYTPTIPQIVAYGPDGKKAYFPEGSTLPDGFTQETPNYPKIGDRVSGDLWGVFPEQRDTGVVVSLDPKSHRLFIRNDRGTEAPLTTLSGIRIEPPQVSNWEQDAAAQVEPPPKQPSLGVAEPAKAQNHPLAGTSDLDASLDRYARETQARAGK